MAGFKNFFKQLAIIDCIGFILAALAAVIVAGGE